MASIGILALQGCIEPHARMFERLGASVKRVRSAEDLNGIERIVLPGGESTTMLKLLTLNRLEEPLKDFCKIHPTWGVCAGSILLAKKVSHPEQRSFELIDVHAIRNYYGSQQDSFKCDVQFQGSSHKVDFIRAPRLEPLSSKPTILATLGESAVMMQDKNILVSSFHAELGDDPVFHRYFLALNRRS